MARFNPAANPATGAPNHVLINLEDELNRTIFAVIRVGSGSDNFSVVALDCGEQTFYYWPTNNTGVLRYGNTMPTIATQDTAGAAV